MCIPLLLEGQQLESTATSHEPVTRKFHDFEREGYPDGAPQHVNQMGSKPAAVLDTTDSLTSDDWQRHNAAGVLHAQLRLRPVLRSL